ncbi:hypothetical protein D3C73_1403020 [compost metagenome]
MTWINPDRKPAGANEAYVWVEKGPKELVQKKIKTGINDNTHVEVLSGLAANDSVINGAQTMGKAAAAGQSQASPFMPKRPGRNNRK